MAQVPTPEESEAAMLAGFRGEVEDVPAGRVECPSCGCQFDYATNLVPAGPARVTE